MGQCSIDIRLGEVKPLEVPVLLLKCFSLGAWREQPGDDQKSHDGIGVELEILVTGLVSKEPVQAQFVVDLQDRRIAEVLLIVGGGLQPFIHVQLQRDLVICLLLFGHFPGHFFEVGDGVIVLLFQNVQPAQGQNGFRSRPATFIAVGLFNGEVDPSIFSA